MSKEGALKEDCSIHSYVGLFVLVSHLRVKQQLIISHILSHRGLSYLHHVPILSYFG